MTRDRWILTTAWALIATAGAAGLWKISKIPAIDPEVVVQRNRIVGEFGREGREGPVGPVPIICRWDFGAQGLSPHPFAATLVPRIIERAVERPEPDIRVMPWLATPTAQASLDGMTLTWTLAKGPVNGVKPERAKEVASIGLRIERNDGSGWKDVAKLDAKATGWTDVATAPRTSYAYRVKLEAPAGMPRAAGGPETEARTPSDRRARLVGGDAKVAIFKVETYDRKKAAWVGRDATVRPGDALWPEGWKLTGLRFKGFMLVAEAVDEDGRAVELTTKD